MKHLRLLTASSSSASHGVCHRRPRRPPRGLGRDRPPGANASAEGHTVTTPGALRLHRSGERPGSRRREGGLRHSPYSLTRKVSGAVWGNLGFLPVGVAAGAAIGAETTKNNGKWFSELEGGMSGGLMGGLVAPAAAIAVDYATGGPTSSTPRRSSSASNR